MREFNEGSGEKLGHRMSFQTLLHFLLSYLIYLCNVLCTTIFAFCVSYVYLLCYTHYVNLSYNKLAKTWYF